MKYVGFKTIAFSLCLIVANAYASCVNHSGYDTYPNDQHKYKGDLAAGTDNSRGFMTYAFDSCNNYVYQAPYYWPGCSVDSDVPTSEYDAIPGDKIHCPGGPKRLVFSWNEVKQNSQSAEKIANELSKMLKDKVPELQDYHLESSTIKNGSSEEYHDIQITFVTDS